MIVRLYDRLGETGLQRFGSLRRYLDLRLNSADQSSSNDRCFLLAQRVHFRAAVPRICLNLEVASHMARDNALVQIQRAQSVTKLLLSDVRDVVGALRSGDSIGLAQALRTLVAGVPAPQIHLLMADNLAIE